ncbi:MAG: hypothetical protein Faunusvirus1_20 [Faunusvirus sp.]|jgi:ankyrin repeat protein|uniref:Uncharacterized protein n=1 Tax=Faunusvirus sp. TaxID=2487766 RepID=A0A3G4ZVX2_9VIRU|nr:MAG: hypothetical protein Faunusvirus1_20 [Faunusvirus sp.]
MSDEYKAQQFCDLLATEYVIYVNTPGATIDDVENKCIKFIKKQGDVRYNKFYNKRVDKTTPFLYVCRFNLKRIVNLMLMSDMDVNNADVTGDTAIISSISWNFFNCIPVIHTLLAHGANCNIKNNDGNTALFYAIRYNLTDVVTMLINGGADFTEILDHNHDITVSKCMQSRYHTVISNIIDDKSPDNKLSSAFRTTYAIQLVDIISQYVI